MNKFIVILVAGTMLVWGVFLYRMSENVNGGKAANAEVAEVHTLDFKSLLKNLEPQSKAEKGTRDTFALPLSYAPKAPALLKIARKDDSSAKPSEALHKVPPPSITLDAILPGSNPVAILKFRGESSVVSVGQQIWGVTVKSIDASSVTLVYSDGEFTLRN